MSDRAHSGFQLWVPVTLFWVIFWDHTKHLLFRTPMLAYMWGQRHLLAQQGSVPRCRQTCFADLFSVCVSLVSGGVRFALLQWHAWVLIRPLSDPGVPSIVVRVWVCCVQRHCYLAGRADLISDHTSCTPHVVHARSQPGQASLAGPCLAHTFGDLGPACISQLAVDQFPGAQFTCAEPGSHVQACTEMQASPACVPAALHLPAASRHSPPPRPHVRSGQAIPHSFA